jgi:uncharacterized protein (TIGR02145 family)
MKKSSFIYSTFVIYTMLFISCGESSDGNGESLSANGGSSKEVIIGKQVWMTENLNVDKFRNGDPIPKAKTPEEWKRAGEKKQAAWCYYDNDPANGVKYGKLYNWYAVNDSRGLAPKGWHIPTDDEWKVLIDYLGGKDVAGKKMKSTSGWIRNGNGTNESGFLGLPGGYRSIFGNFMAIGCYGDWWSISEEDTNYAYELSLYRNFDSTGNYMGFKIGGLSVRCLKD